MRPDGHLDRPCTCDAWWVLTQSRRRCHAPTDEGGTSTGEVYPAGDWFPRTRMLARILADSVAVAEQTTDWQQFELADAVLAAENRWFRRWNKWKKKQEE